MSTSTWGWALWSVLCTTMLAPSAFAECKRTKSPHPGVERHRCGRHVTVFSCAKGCAERVRQERLRLMQDTQATVEERTWRRMPTIDGLAIAHRTHFFEASDARTIGAAFEVVQREDGAHAFCAMTRVGHDEDVVCEDALRERLADVLGGRLIQVQKAILLKDMRGAERMARRLLRDKRLRDEQKVRAHLLLGIAAHSRGERGVASQSFLQALRLDPDVTLERAGVLGTSRCRRFFHSVRRRAQDDDAFAQSAGETATKTAAWSPQKLPTSCRVDRVVDRGEAHCEDGTTLTWEEHDSLMNALGGVQADLAALQQAGDVVQVRFVECLVAGKGSRCARLQVNDVPTSWWVAGAAPLADGRAVTVRCSHRGRRHLPKACQSWMQLR